MSECIKNDCGYYRGKLGTGLNSTMRRDRILKNSSFISALVSRRSERQWNRLRNYRL